MPTKGQAKLPRDAKIQEIKIVKRCKDSRNQNCHKMPEIERCQKMPGIKAAKRCEINCPEMPRFKKSKLP